MLTSGTHTPKPQAVNRLSSSARTSLSTAARRASVAAASAVLCISRFMSCLTTSRRCRSCSTRRWLFRDAPLLKPRKALPFELVAFSSGFKVPRSAFPMLLPIEFSASAGAVNTLPRRPPLGPPSSKPSNQGLSAWDDEPTASRQTSKGKVALRA